LPAVGVGIASHNPFFDRISGPVSCAPTITGAFGAVCPRRGATAALVMPAANTEAMNAHLTEISKTVASGAHAILVMDGAGWHGAKTLCIPDSISIVILPPYAPELNPVENIWAYLRANCLAVYVFDTYDDIVVRCCDAWNFFATIPNASAQSVTANMRKRFKTIGPLVSVPCRTCTKSYGNSR